MEIVSPQLRQLLSFWEGRAQAGVPLRSDFQPTALRFILGGISLIDVHETPPPFFYRVHGTRMSGWLGFDLTGKYLDDAPNKDWAALAGQHLAQVTTRGVPSLAWHWDKIIGGRLWNLEALVLPISRVGGNVDMLISAVMHHPRKARDVFVPESGTSEYIPAIA